MIFNIKECDLHIIEIIKIFLQIPYPLLSLLMIGLLLLLFKSPSQPPPNFNQAVKKVLYFLAARQLHKS